jgi:predicted tellurium resistance membrane protein TerC
MDFAALFTVDNLIGLLTLTVLEIVLGIDNVIFISILSGKVEKSQQKKTRNIGLILALVVRVGLLFGISYIIGMKDDLFAIFGHGFSGRDLILLAGGLFLLYKSTTEIHEKVVGEEHQTSNGKKAAVGKVIVQIILLDVVFSFDSILTAVGLSDNITIMITAVIISMIVMLIFASKIADFINSRPTIKMIALSFLMMIGLMLILEGFHVEVPKGYVYFAMVYSLTVEFLNIRMRKNKGKAKMKAKGVSEVNDETTE